MDGISSAGGMQAQASTSMLQKTLGFQANMAAAVISNGTQGNDMNSPQRTEAMQAQGKGQQLNIQV